MEYRYSTKQFGITEEGIDFLRNDFVYKTIPFSEIDTVEFKKGMQLNNWIVIFLIGTALFSIGIYMFASIVDLFSKGEVHTRGVRIVYLLFIPIVGAYFLYESLQYGLILKISYQGIKKKRFHLKRLTPESRQKFGEFMEAKMGRKFINELAQARVRLS